ncbi:VacJ family lipoprotein, partial [Francisella tularensis subsp. holarctica]|nr:VacJ family lipoprotein [Francisella tularensis subsp. holarctica]
MEKVLKQKYPALETTQQINQAILSVLGISDKNGKSEIASSGESFVQASSDTTAVLKSSLSSVNQVAEV